MDDKNNEKLKKIKEKLQKIVDDNEDSVTTNIEEQSLNENQNPKKLLFGNFQADRQLN